MVNQVFLQFDTGFHAFLLILQGCYIVNHLVGLSISKMMVVGARASVEQVAIYEVNLGVFVPTPQEQGLFAVLASSLQSGLFHGNQINGDANLGQVSLDYSCNLLIGSAGCIGQGGLDRAGYAGFLHQLFSAFQIEIITGHFIIEAPQATVQNGLLHSAFAVQSSVQNGFLVDSTSNCLTQLLVIPRLLFYVESKVEQTSARLFVNSNLLIFLQEFQVVNGRINANVDFAGLQCHYTSRSFNHRTEFNNIGYARSKVFGCGQVISPVILNLYQTAVFALNPFLIFVGAGAD